MKCEEIRERMPDVAADFSQVTTEESNHLAGCSVCTEQLKSMKATMALLDEWQVPEPSPYFDVRLQARLREEKAHQPVTWWHWIRKPALAVSLSVIMVMSVTLLFRTDTGWNSAPGPRAMVVEPGTAVGDLQALDRNN